MTYDELKAQGVDAARIPESQWEYIGMSEDGTRRLERAWIEKPHGDKPGISVQRAVNLHEEAILASNKESYNTDQSFIRKGQELDAKVANVPLNVMYNDKKLLEGLQGDRDKLKSWLNDDENRIYRTIKGKV